MMEFKYDVVAQVGRVSGKFVGRDEIGDLLRGEIEDAAQRADLVGLGADGDSEYEVLDVEVADA